MIRSAGEYREFDNSLTRQLPTPHIHSPTIRESLTISVINQSGEECYFKVKESTKMSMVMGSYAKREGVVLIHSDSS